MNWKVIVACGAGIAATVVACEDVTPTPPSPAFEAMLAAANASDGGEDGSVGADDGDANYEAGDSGVE